MGKFSLIPIGKNTKLFAPLGIKLAFISGVMLTSFSVYSLHKDPWFHSPFECDFATSFSYRIFSHVQGAKPSLSSSLHDRDLKIDLGWTPLPLWDVRFEGEFAKVEGVNWALRSGAMQTRLGIWDDLVGDPISITLGLNVRGATRHFLHSVATPYAAELNVELTGAIGKEWSNRSVWLSRLFALAKVGQANRGSPWIDLLGVYQINVQNAHRFTLFTEGLLGFGTRKRVNIDHFRGWAPYQYRAIDLGGGYGYHFGPYGELSIQYGYRVFARSFPEHVNTFVLTYAVPFSPF